MAKMTVKRAVREYLAEIGAKGGRKRSARKTKAAQENAKKPRPRKAA